MTVSLPDGYTWRRATPDDAEVIFGLVSRYNIEVLGRADVTITDLADQLGEPGFDLTTDSWLGYTPDASLAGFAWAISQGGGQHVDVDVITRDEALSHWMYHQVLRRAAEHASAGGHPGHTVDQGIYRQDTWARAAAAEHGFTARTTFHRMRIDHESTVKPALPDGVTVHTGPGDEEFRRTAHAVLGESFAEHYGWFPTPFEDWQRKLDQERSFHWPQLAVAKLDSRPVAIMVTSDRYVADDNCGYVAELGVLPAARGRGIARYLLRAAFAADARAGRVGTILHVDTNNPTPALDLYTGVGMRPVLVIDVWRRAVGGANG